MGYRDLAVAREFNALETRRANEVIRKLWEERMYASRKPLQQFFLRKFKHTNFLLVLVRTTTHPHQDRAQLKLGGVALFPSV